MGKLNDLHTVRSCIFGLAVGDALGVPVEFRSRGELDRDPVTGMRGHGTYNMPAGSWSDDTSMTLCALDALDWESGFLCSRDYNWDPIMENFERWLHGNEYTPTNYTFDAGAVCVRAIEKFCNGEAPLNCGLRGEQDNGNGSLMRTIPFVLFAPYRITFIEQASALTHAHRRSTMACGIYAMILKEILKQHDKQACFWGLLNAKEQYGNEKEWKHYAPLFDIEKRTRDSIRSSGYVVDTLEAALWCLVTTDSYRECVLKAVNLGGDTDTVAAVAGGLAGALYGIEAIPEEWLSTLLRRDYIEELCSKAAGEGFVYVHDDVEFVSDVDDEF